MLAFSVRMFVFDDKPIVIYRYIYMLYKVKTLVMLIGQYYGHNHKSSVRLKTLNSFFSGAYSPTTLPIYVVLYVSLLIF